MRTNVSSDRFMELCKAIGHETRFEIIKLLMNRTKFCGDLVQELGVAQSTVSHHLKILKQVGLVETEDQGSWVCYKLQLSTFAEMQEILNGLIKEMK